MLRLRPLAAFMLAIPLLACAAGTAATTDSVRQAFEKKFPQRQVQAVRATPVTGIYEIVLPDRQVVYADAKVKHLFVGDLIDVDARQSLTEARVAELSKVDWKNLPLDLAFKEVRGNGSRKLAVFSDPDCPFCKRLERDSLKGVTNVTIYTFLYPLTSLHPDAMHKSAQILCSSNPQAAWSDFMLNDKPLAGDGKCAAADKLASIQQLAEKLGISGTPALVFPNGQLVSGAIPKADVEKLLNSK